MCKPFPNNGKILVEASPLKNSVHTAENHKDFAPSQIATVDKLYSLVVNSSTLEAFLSQLAFDF